MVHNVGSQKLSRMEQDCRIRNMEGGLSNEVWGKPPVSKDLKQNFQPVERR